MNRYLRINKYQASNLADYSQRGKLRSPCIYKIGEKINNFEVVGIKAYKDFGITHFEFNNRDNNLQYHHLECQQENNILTFLFPTPQNLKHGLNYAVDKMIQAGCHKYPVRNIINQMTNRSFNKINTVYTTEDYLMFSFQTHCLKDYKNLFRVYANILFNPLMRQEDFQQLVVRKSFSQHNPKKQLLIAGEMAKQMQQYEHYLQYRIYKAIYSQLLGKKKLAICSPEQLLSLTHNDVLKFHKQYFTTSNCIMVGYGDLNPVHTIQLAVNTFKDLNPKTHNLSKINKQQTNEENHNKELKGTKTINVQHLQPQSPLILSYKIPENISQEQHIKLSILSYILFDMPESPFMIFNTIQTPYPRLYGYRQKYFNIGISLEPKDNKKHIDQKQYFQKQLAIKKLLQDLVINGIDDVLIESCLNHFEGSYSKIMGIDMIQNISSMIIKNSKLDQIFQVQKTIRKLFKSYRKNSIFQNLINDYFLNSQIPCLKIFGARNKYLIQDLSLKRQKNLEKIKETLSKQEITNILNYCQPNILQNFSILPEVNPIDIQLFQQPQIDPIQIKGVPVYIQERIQGNNVCFKIDISTIQEQDLSILKLFCQAFPKMGMKSCSNQQYNLILRQYIEKIQMKFQTVKISPNEMKIFLFLDVEFINKNIQHAFQVVNGLFNDFAFSNTEELSKTIRKSASQCFNLISEDLLNYHGMYLAASKSPFCQIQDPIFHSRALCGIAAETSRVTHPKQLLLSICERFRYFVNQLRQKRNLQVFLRCQPEKRSIACRYLELVFSGLSQKLTFAQSIEFQNFSQLKWIKYFPNYEQEVVFQAFKMPYRQPNSPASLLLSSIINNNIKKFNPIGGCFMHKGAMVALIGGSRRKFIQLQDYYKKLDSIDQAKRQIFQTFAKHTFQQKFKTGVSMKEAKLFKQAILATQKQELQGILQKYILNKIKEGQTSLLALGPRLQNYQPLLKKGWQIERSIDGTSLRMQSLSTKELNFQVKEFLKIC